MRTNVKITPVDSAPREVPFYELEVGSWYDSRSCYGLCVKISAYDAFSVTTNALVKNGKLEWMCIPAGVDIRYRLA